jgi:hypothetical protein
VVEGRRYGLRMYYDEFINYTEAEYLAEYEFRNDPARWKEHHPSDDDYVPYVFSLDSGFQVKQKLVEYLSMGGLSYFERERAKYLLRAVERDIRQMKIGHNNEPSR